MTTRTKRKPEDETQVQEEGGAPEEEQVALSTDQEALLAIIAAENAEKPDEQAMADAEELLLHSNKMSLAAKNFPMDKIPDTHIKVTANRRFGQIDPQSKRGISKTIAGANGTGRRMVEPGEYAIISKEAAHKLQKNGVIDIVF